MKAKPARTRVVSVAEPYEQVAFFVVEPDRPTLTELARLVDAGDLRPVVGAVAPLRDGAAAFAAKQGVTGKSVLTVSGDAQGTVDRA
jgi:NADPH:quinone reductase-like Zn-dependent oxidoreductase